MDSLKIAEGVSKTYSREAEQTNELATHKQASHSPIHKRQTLNSLLLRQTVHDVQQRDEAGRLHRSPADLSRYVEPRRRRGLAHGVVCDEPLDQSGLRKVGLVETFRLWLHGVPYDGEELPEEVEELPVLAGGRAPGWYDGHSFLLLAPIFLCTGFARIYGL